MKQREQLIKESKEWQALNSIWKSCSPEQKEALRSDFEVITSFFKKNSYRLTSPNDEESVDTYYYLEPLSEEARAFLMQIVGQGGKNLYHSFMSYLDAKDDMDKSAVLESYYKRFAAKRPYLIENKALVSEIFDLCWQRYHSKS
jgi:hypothetical protein